MSPAAASAVEGHFTHTEEWTDRYQRNNKRSGLKNLRCFPYCLDKHRSKGFCGRPVSFEITRNDTKAPLYSWAEFVKIGDDLKVEVGAVMPKDDAHAQERDRKDSNRSWYFGALGDSATADEPGISRNGDQVAFRFNNQKKGWNYGWAASKHTCSAEHSLRVYVFAQRSSTMLECVGTFDSPVFTLYCRRRPTTASSAAAAAAAGLPHSAISGAPRVSDSDSRSAAVRLNKALKRPNTMAMASNSSHIESYNSRGAEGGQANHTAAAASAPKRVRVEESRNQDFAENAWTGNYQAQQQQQQQHQQQQQQQQRNQHEKEAAAFIADAFAIDTHQSNGNNGSAYASHNGGYQAEEKQQQQTQEEERPFRSRGTRGAMLVESQHSQRSMEEAEKALNARLWRLTVILDLLESRWNESCLGPVKEQRCSEESFMQSLAEMDFLQNPLSRSHTPSGAAATQSTSTTSTLNQRLNLNPVMLKIKEELPMHGHRSQPHAAALDVENEFDAEFDAIDLDDADDMMQSFLDEPTRPSQNNRNNNNNNNIQAPMPAAAPQGVEPVDGLNSTAPSAAPGRTYVLDEFGRYLLFECDITREIQQALSTVGGTQAESVHLQKAGFMQVMNVHLGKFLLSHGMSLREFEDLIGESMKEKNIDPVSRRPHAVARFRTLLHQIQYSPTQEEMNQITNVSPTLDNHTSLSMMMPGHVNISGTWAFDDNIRTALCTMREMRGLPWIMRQMLAGMEDKVDISQSDDKVYFQHKRKMLSNGLVAYNLDGKQHPWTCASPVPWTKALAYSSRASFEGDHFRFEHYYSQNVRSKRLFRRCASGDRLEVIVAIQFKEPKKLIWEEQFSAQGFAYAFDPVLDEAASLFAAV